jgi:hypothetical protein
MCITMESPLVLEYLDLPVSARGELCQGVVVVDVPDPLAAEKPQGPNASSENLSASFFPMLYSNNSNYANNKNAHPRYIAATCNKMMDSGSRSSNKKDHVHLDLVDDESSMGFRDQWVAATFGQPLSDVITLMQ